MGAFSSGETSSYVGIVVTVINFYPSLFDRALNFLIVFELFGLY